MPVGQLGEHLADLAELRRVAAGQEAGERLAFCRQALCLAKHLAYEAPSPQRQPAGYGRIRHDRRAYPGHHQIGVTFVRQYLVNEGLCLRIGEVRNRV